MLTLAALDTDTDDQTLSLAGNTLSIADGNSVDLSGYVSTDDQNLTGATLTGNTLQIDIENGTSASVDLSALDNSGTDDQALSLAGNTLTLEDGGSVDLSGYVSTDDQNLTGATLTGNTLQIDIENGSSASVDLSSIDTDTDDQTLSLAGNTLSIADGNSVDLSGYVSTDDQNLTGATLTGNTLQIDIENGTSASVDLSALDNSGTDDQALSLAGNTLTLEDGGSVDLSGYVSTDDQNLTLAGNTLSIEDGNNVDLSGYLDNTDDQNLTGATLTGNTLQIDIENGTSASVDLSALDNSGTDDQALSLAGNTLTLEDGGSVDLSGYVSTDDQNIQNLGLVGTTLTVGIESGTSQTVDLTTLVGTDDQALSLAGNTLTLEDGGSVDLSAYLDDTDTDDQTLSLAGNTLSIADGNSVDLSGYVSTDDQVISTTGAAGNITIESGNTLNLNVNDADADPTNERNTAFAVNGANLDITDSGGTLSVPLSTLGTDDQYDDEVPLRTPIDVDDAGKSVAQGYAVENNVQQVINAIAPITSKAARIFYPPSIAVDASTNGTGRTLNLYTQYTAQFATPAVSSAGAPTAIPTYTAAELYYYVTYYDPTVFANVSINASGVMTYDVIAQPTDYNSLINVVFVVR